MAGQTIAYHMQFHSTRKDQFLWIYWAMQTYFHFKLINLNIYFRYLFYNVLRLKKSNKKYIVVHAKVKRFIRTSTSSTHYRTIIFTKIWMYAPIISYIGQTCTHFPDFPKDCLNANSINTVSKKIYEITSSALLFCKWHERTLVLCTAWPALGMDIPLFFWLLTL